MKKLTTYLTLLLACFLLACNNDEAVNFTYSPATPRAGENVTFSNLTKEGEDWKWTFGDGGESTLHSPIKVYRQAGTYTVTLKVDGKKSRTCTQTINVLDTMPSITCSVKELAYYQTATFKVDCYNPNNENVTYQWTLPESAVIVSGNNQTATIGAYFTEKTTDVNVSVLLTIGTKAYTLKATYHVNDTPAKAVYCVTSDDKLLRQRLYENGIEEPVAINMPAAYLTNTHALLLNKDELYVLSKGIHALNLTTLAAQTILPEANALSGFISQYTLCWNDATTLHNLHLTVRTDKVLASTSQLTGFPHTAITAIAPYASLYLVAGDKGIYRFQETDIDSGVAPATAPILSQYAISKLAVDAIARKLYFIADGVLYVSNIDGEYPVKIADQASTIAIDNTTNRIYFATTQGIAYLPLVQTPNNTSVAQATMLNSTSNVVAIAVDNTAR